MWRRGLGANRCGSLSAVPDDLREQYDQIVSRAAALRPPGPVLEVAGEPCHSSRVVLAASGESATPRVRLSADLLGTPPANRAWSIAYELGHILFRQEGARPAGAPVFLVIAAVLATGAVVCVFGAGWAMSHSPGSLAGGLAAAALLQVGGLWLVWLALLRREEAATDAVAAVVFGEVLTPAGVERLCRREVRCRVTSRRCCGLIRAPAHDAAPVWPRSRTADISRLPTRSVQSHRAS
jgi:hypothetical protein